MSYGVNERFDFAEELPDLQQLRAAHLLAIGGSGMSGVARLLHDRGIRVTGTDALEVPVLEELRALGMDITVGYTASTAEALEPDVLVVVSSAVPETNPELAAVRRRGLRVVHRSQALGMLMAGTQGIAVAGTNGKTTTSAMTAVALRGCGHDPSFAIGAPIAGWGTNSGIGSGNSFVVEADESDGSFVVYQPQVAIVTSIKDDHLDFYTTSEAMHAAYDTFARTITAGGLLVTCGDDPGAAALAQRARDRGQQVVSYGHEPHHEVQVEDEYGADFSWGATLRVGGGVSVPLRLMVPGRHNVLNAAGVVAALTTGLGLPAERVARALSDFRGALRRFEVRGQQAGVRVVDDYAHNPGKLDAVVRTGRALRHDGRLIVVFQPHLYSRTRNAAAGLAQALGGADVAIVLDVYGAREQPVPGISGRLISDRVDAPVVRFAPDADAALALVLQHARAGDLVLTVGAGDVTLLGPRILEALRARG